MHTPPYIQAFAYISIDNGQKPSISRLRKGKGTPSMMGSNQAMIALEL